MRHATLVKYVLPSQATQPSLQTSDAGEQIPAVAPSSPEETGYNTVMLGTRAKLSSKTDCHFLDGIYSPFVLVAHPRAGSFGGGSGSKSASNGRSLLT
jgi:hypothetical protein